MAGYLMAHKHDPIQYAAYKANRQRVRDNQLAVEHMPAQSQQHAADAAAANSVPQLRQTVAEQALMLETALGQIDALSKILEG